jgi:hypothetical protein
MELVAPGGACPAGVPVLPDQAPAGGASVASCPAWVHRGDADLCAGWGRSRPAPARVTAQRPAVRVLARGGGGVRVPGRLPRRCLAQRRERRGRVYGLAHQLAERALLRAACGRRGEHVFVRLGRPSDGTRTLRSSVREAAQIWLRSGEFGRDFCNRSCIRPRPDEDRGSTRGRGERVVVGANEWWSGRTSGGWGRTSGGWGRTSRGRGERVVVGAGESWSGQASRGEDGRGRGAAASASRATTRRRSSFAPSRRRRR